MAQFENISHGEANWEQKVNKNFSNVVQDSGWVDVPLLAPASGSISIRLLNQILYLAGGGITVNSVGKIPVAVLPITSKKCIAADVNKREIIMCDIDSTGTLSIVRTEENQSNFLNLQLNSYLVGNISLGGVATPLYQRFKAVFDRLFNTKLEVA